MMHSWRRALVTGASSGIGRGVALALAERGTDLVLVGLDDDDLRSTAAELRQRVDVVALPADLTKDSDVARVAACLGDDRRPIDLLCNNAGFGRRGAFGAGGIAVELDMVHLMVASTLRLTDAAIRVMPNNGGGAIINTASCAGFTPSPNFATYAACKSFLIHFGLAVTEELRGSSVSLTTVAPGYTRTAFAGRAGLDPGRVPRALWQSPDEVAAAALRGAARGRALVVPGTVNRFMAATIRRAPFPVAIRVAASLTR